MKLYIPEHLRKVKVVDQLYKMYTEYLEGTNIYGERYYTEEPDPFEGYHKYKITDPVRRFLENWINEETLKEAGMDKSAVISYLVKLFYSLKGTPRVLDYVKVYLGLSFDYTYSTALLEVNIKAEENPKGIRITDMGLFVNDFYGFCSELLYFHNTKSSVDKIKINVVEGVKNVVSSDYIPYKYWSATEK